MSETAGEHLAPELDVDDAQPAKRMARPKPGFRLGYPGSATEFLTWIGLVSAMIKQDCEIVFCEKEIRARSRDGQDAIFFYDTSFKTSWFTEYEVNTRVKGVSKHKIIVTLPMVYSMLKQVRKIDTVHIEAAVDGEHIDITVHCPAVFTTSRDGEAREIQTEFETDREWHIKLVDVALCYTEPIILDFHGRLEIGTQLFYNTLKQAAAAGSEGQIQLSERVCRFLIQGDAASAVYTVNQFTEDHKAQNLTMTLYKEDGKPAVICLAWHILLQTEMVQLICSKLVLMISEEPGNGKSSCLHLHAMFDKGLGFFKFWMAGKTIEN